MITVRSKTPTAKIIVSSSSGGKKVLFLKESLDKLYVSPPRNVTLNIELPNFSSLPNLP